MLRIEVDPGGGVDAHYHDARHEYFEVEEGVLDLTLDGELIRLSAGETAECPPEMTHAFHNRSDTPVVFIAKITPGHTEFENLLRVASGLARDGEIRDNGLPRDFATLSLFAGWSETQLPGVLWKLARPLLAWGHARALSRWARSTVDRALWGRAAGVAEAPGPHR